MYCKQSITKKIYSRSSYKTYYSIAHLEMEPAYPLFPWMIKPFNFGPALTRSEKLFNPFMDNVVKWPNIL